MVRQCVAQEIPVAGTIQLWIRLMALNKKQKKQIEAAKNKIQRLQHLLNAARKQPDDPEDIPKLEAQIASLQAEIEKIRNG
jgi:peptidoglycan hydrolase CwlO-like protein